MTKRASKMAQPDNLSLIPGTHGRTEMTPIGGSLTSYTSCVQGHTSTHTNKQTNDTIMFIRKSTYQNKQTWSQKCNTSTY